METLFDQIIRATGWAILHSLWQGAVIYGLLYLATLPIIKSKASSRYNLSTFGGLLLSVGFIFTFIRIFQWPLDQGAGTSPSPLSVPLSDLIHAPALPLLEYLETVVPWLVLFYNFGLFIQGVLFWKGYQRIQLLKTAIHHAVPADWQLRLENLKEELGITRKISYYLSEKVQVPLVIGYLKPVILFPVMLSTHLDSSQIEAIMIHELSHIRRNDYLFNLLRTVTETLLFFNPFIWQIGRMIDVERENACDDQVIRLTQTPLTYARALLQLEILSNQQQPVLALAATGKEQYLYQRIKRITNMKTENINAKQKLITLAITLATLVSLAWINPAARTQELQKGAAQKVKKIPVASNTVSGKIPVTYRKRKHTYIYHGGQDTVAPVFFIPPPVPPVPPIPRVPAVPPVPPVPDLTLEIQPPLSIEFNEKLNSALTDLNIAINDSLQVKIKQQREAMRKHYLSPEQQARWKKYGRDIEATFNSPEQKAKFKKYQQDMQKYQQDMQKYQQDMQKHQQDMQNKQAARQAKWVATNP